MTKISCPALCLYAVNGQCVAEEITLSYKDYGHMMCETQLSHHVSGKANGFTVEDVCEIYPGLGSIEVSALVNNKDALKAMSDEERRFLCRLVNCLIKQGR